MKGEHNIVNFEVKGDDLYITYKVEAATFKEESEYLNRLTTCFNVLRKFSDTALRFGVIGELVELANNVKFMRVDDKDRHTRIKILSRSIFAKLEVK